MAQIIKIECQKCEACQEIEADESLVFWIKDGHIHTWSHDLTLPVELRFAQEMLDIIAEEIEKILKEQ